jgi:hypothetical protein
MNKKKRKPICCGSILIAVVSVTGIALGILWGYIPAEGIFYDSYIGQFGLDGYINHYGWDAIQLRSIEKDVQSDLCMRFDLPPEDPLCDPNNTVTDPDFFPIINDTFKPKNQEWATYEEVQSYLEPYAYCGPYNVTAERIIPTYCEYSFSGSKVSTFLIRFDARTGVLYEILSGNKRDFR